MQPERAGRGPEFGPPTRSRRFIGCRAVFVRIDRFVLGLATAATLATVSPRAEAARDLQAPARSSREIIVIEIGGCKYCPRLRQDVADGYARSPSARVVPIRFVDVTAHGADHLKLKAPINVVPTAVVMHESVEVGRIEGYVAPEDFVRLIGELLAR